MTWSENIFEGDEGTFDETISRWRQGTCFVDERQTYLHTRRSAPLRNEEERRGKKRSIDRLSDQSDTAWSVRELNKGGLNIHTRAGCASKDLLYERQDLRWQGN